MMNLIDISSWQAGIDLPAVFAQNPIDGVIVKATQGTGYVNPEYAGWTAWLADHDKPFGFYHYLNGAAAAAEAEHFYQTVRQYIRKGIPVADYEGEALSRGTAWLRAFLDRFRELSGVRAMIYCSLSVVQSQDFSELTEHPLWIAQYADMAPVRGFLDKPWQQGSVAPFGRYVMHQYTPCGRLNGYGGDLDLDQFAGSYSYWLELARGDGADPAPDPAALKPADPVVVGAILAGGYGNGPERAARLRAAGYDPEDVQNKVNELYAIALSCKRYIRGNEDYLSAIEKILRVL